MGKKIFVSYKYSDSQVYSFSNSLFKHTTARDYVDEIERILEGSDHIYKGEDDGESMASLADSTIGSKLGDKIFDSTITIVLISKGMKTYGIPDEEQWIPWEVSYSLKEQSRSGMRSKTNAVLAVVLPDELNSYGYYIVDDSCPYCHCRTLNTGMLFDVIKNNMFNVRSPDLGNCQNHGLNKVYNGYSSYIHSVKWKDFILDPNKYVGIALDIRARINEYNVQKTV